MFCIYVCVVVVECFMLVWSKVSEGQKFSLQLELCVWRVDSGELWCGAGGW